MRPLVVLLVAACADPASVKSLPADQLAAHTWGASAVIPGQPMTATLRDLTSPTSIGGIAENTQVVVRVSSQLARDACEYQVFGTCMDVGVPGLDSPTVLLQGGVATNTIDVPPSLPNGSTVFVQAAGQTPRGFSRSSAIIVERRVGCGDGVVGPGEQCDDGNIDIFDGCDAVCLEEHDVQVHTAGIRYGNCVGDACEFKVRFDRRPEVWLTSGPDGSSTWFGVTFGQLTLFGQQELADAYGVISVGPPLESVYGCPDCADQGELFYDFGFQGDATIDPLAVPASFQSFEIIRGAVTDGLRTCVANAYVTPEPTCVPR